MLQNNYFYVRPNGLTKVYGQYVRTEIVKEILLNSRIFQIKKLDSFNESNKKVSTDYLVYSGTIDCDPNGRRYWWLLDEECYSVHPTMGEAVKGLKKAISESLCIKKKKKKNKKNLR